jgi:hypothetical protein
MVFQAVLLFFFRSLIIASPIHSLTRQSKQPIMLAVCLEVWKVERGRFYQQFDAGLPGGNTPKRDNGGDLPTPSHQIVERQVRPEVLELLSILYDTWSLQRNLQSVARERQFQTSTEPSQAIERHGELFSIDPSFVERYRRAGLFVEAAVHIMRGSFEGYPEDPEYLRSVLDAAFAPYGFEVADGGNNDIWKNEYTDYEVRKGERLRQYEQIRRATVIPTKLLDFYHGEGQWETAGQWQEEPEVLAFNEQVNRIKTVYERMSPLSHGIRYRQHRHHEGNEDEAIPGLQPYHRERYFQAEGILDNTLHGVMLEGLSYERHSTRWLFALINNVNEALYELDMHVDVKADWQPGKRSGRVVSIQEVKNGESKS